MSDNYCDFMEKKRREKERLIKIRDMIKNDACDKYCYHEGSFRAYWDCMLDIIQQEYLEEWHKEAK